MDGRVPRCPPVVEIALVARNQREPVQHGDDREIGGRTVAATLEHRHPELTTFSEYFGDGGKDIYGLPKLVERAPERLAEWHSFQRRRRIGSARFGNQLQPIRSGSQLESVDHLVK